MNGVAKKWPSKDWLWQRYWNDKLTMSEIGKEWALHVDRTSSYSHNTVHHWMKFYSIPRRPRGQRMARLATTDTWKKRSRAHVENLRLQGRAYAGHSGDKITALQKARTKQQVKDGWDTRKCCNPICAQYVKRIKSMFRNEWYCSHKCHGQALSEMSRKQKHDAMLEGLKQQADALFLKARNDARAQLGLPPEQEAA